MDHLTVGKIGEQLAKDYLTKQKYQILFSNYRFHHLEIDIIALKHKTLYFFEVKTRNYRAYQLEKDLDILPEEEFTHSKKQKFIKASDLFILKNYQFKNYQIQLNLLAIYLFNDHPPIYKIYENIS